MERPRVGVDGEEGERLLERSENHLQHFFRYFSLTPAQKCHYAQIKLAGEVVGRVILTVEIGLFYKNFIFGMLHTSRDHNSTIWSLNAKISSLAW